MTKKKNAKTRTMSVSKSTLESRARVVAHARAALRLLGNASPSEGQQDLALSAIIHATARVDAGALQAMAKEIVTDTHAEPLTAFALASVLIGLIETHDNHTALIKYLRCGGPRPSVKAAFLALVKRVDIASGKAA